MQSTIGHPKMPVRGLRCPRPVDLFPAQSGTGIMHTASVSANEEELLYSRKVYWCVPKRKNIASKTKMAGC
eukprot:11459016-Heterocapsa_arctica.AAC.1